MRCVKALLLLCMLMSACSENRPRSTAADPHRQVTDTERAFAKTMADRNFAAFQEFLSPEAVFFSGQQPTTGKAEVVRQWKAFYAEPAAPFFVGTGKSRGPAFGQARTEHGPGAR